MFELLDVWMFVPIDGRPKGLWHMQIYQSVATYMIQCKKYFYDAPK
jgi:hypothetical protein